MSIPSGSHGNIIHGTSTPFAYHDLDAKVIESKLLSIFFENPLLTIKNETVLTLVSTT